MGTLQQMFIRVYRLEVQSVMLVFSIQLCELLPPNLLTGSTLNISLCEYIYLYTRIRCVRGVCGSGP